MITIRGAVRLAAADIVVWASSLVPESMLGHTRAGALLYDSASMTLEDVIGLYRLHPDAAIVRLHSGDPSVFGAIQEQIDYCVAEGRDFEIVPGVTSVAAAAAALGRELTVPSVSQSLVFTRLAGRTAASMPERESVAAFAAIGATMAVFLSAARPAELQAELMGPTSGYTASTPAAIVIRASWPDERVITTTVGALAAELTASGATMTTLVLVGDAIATGSVTRSHLYSPEFAHSYRRRSTAGRTTGRPVPRRP